MSFDYRAQRERSRLRVARAWTGWLLPLAAHTSRAFGFRKTDEQRLADWNEKERLRDLKESDALVRELAEADALVLAEKAAALEAQA